MVYDQYGQIVSTSPVKIELKSEDVRCGNISSQSCQDRVKLCYNSLCKPTPICVERANVDRFLSIHTRDYIEFESCGSLTSLETPPFLNDTSDCSIWYDEIVTEPVMTSINSIDIEEEVYTRFTQLEARSNNLISPMFPVKYEWTLFNGSVTNTSVNTLDVILDTWENYTFSVRAL